MRTLNLAISVPYVPPTYIGGGETYIYHLTRELAGMGVNINLFTTRLPKDKGEWDWHHVKLHECRSLFSVGNTPLMPSLPVQMLRHNRSDLIHTAVPSGFACDVSALVAGVTRKPLVVLYHCDVILSSLTAKAYNSILKLYTLQQADRIISTTLSYAQTSPLLRHFMDKVRVVPMGTHLVEYPFHARDRQAIRARYGINDKEKVILFVGGLGYFHRFKRVDLLIRAMAEIVNERQDVSLIIVGKGNLQATLQAMCRELRLEKVIFTGYAANEDLPRYYSAADLFVLPSLTREEAFGIVLVEAASCGVVPVTFDIPGPGEVCRELGGFVAMLSDASEPQAELAQTILQALSSDLPVASDICRRNAQRYAWSEVAQRTLEIYRELLSR